MEELGPPSAVRNQPEPQEQRERARLCKGHCRYRGRGTCGQMVVWEGIKDDLSVLCPSRPQCLHHPPALTRATRQQRLQLQAHRCPLPAQAAHLLPPTRHTPLEPLPVAYNLLDFLTQTSFFSSPLGCPLLYLETLRTRVCSPSILGTDSLRIVFALCPSQRERVLFPGFGS